MSTSVTMYRVESGFIFGDDFTTLDGRWTLSPIGSGNLNERFGFMRLRHDAVVDTLMLCDIPQADEVAIEVSADFAPTVEGDEAGIVVWQNADERIDFVEKYNALSTLIHSSWMALKENGNWRFYSDTGSGLNFVDSDNLGGATRFGVVVKRGVNTEFKNVDVDKVLVTRGNKLTVLNLSDGYTVRLEKPDGSLIAQSTVGSGNSGVQIRMPQLSITGGIVILDTVGVEIARIDAIFYGGDIYSIGTSVEVRRGGTELNRSDFTDLGSMSSGSLIESFEVFNPATAPVSNVKLSIEQYTTKFGWTWADISLSNSGPWSKQLTIPSVGAGSSVPFWLQVTKGTDYMGIEPLQFKVHLEHS